MLVIRGALAGDAGRLMIEARADPHDRCALLDGDDVVLGGAHRQLLRPCASASSRSAANQRAAVLADPPTAAASSSARPPARASARCRRRSPPGAMPALPGSPATLTSSRIAQPGPRERAVALELAQRGLGRERVDQPHVRHDQAHRRLCSWPMKSHSNSSPWAATFSCRSWARFSPTRRDAGLGEQRADPRRRRT